MPKSVNLRNINHVLIVIIFEVRVPKFYVTSFSKFFFTVANVKRKPAQFAH